MAPQRAAGHSTAYADPFHDVVFAPRRGPDGDDADSTESRKSRAERPVATGPSDAVPARRFSRVLVVDDDDGVRRQLSYLLEDEGYDVKVAATGSAALMVAQEHAFDVVILDVRLPDLSGIEVFEAFQSRSTSVKTIIVSGYLVDEEIAAAESRGAHFLAKPVDSDRLLKLLALLERAKGDAP